MDRNEKLSYRERQLMDILYKLGEASASQVMEAMPDPPGFSSVRKWLFILEGKNLITHRKEGRQFLYTPAIPRERAMKKAIDRLAEVFFEGSKARAAATFQAMSRMG